MHKLSKNICISTLKCFVYIVIYIFICYFSQYHPFLWLVCIIATGLISIVFIYELVKETFIERKVNIALIIFFIVVSGVPLILRLSQSGSWIDRVKIAVQTKDMSACRTNGVLVGNNQTLGICAIDQRWWRYGLTKSIIYDPSDEISYLRSSQTSEWKLATSNMDRIVPFGIRGYTAEKISGHYYLVTFYDVLDPVEKN